MDLLQPPHTYFETCKPRPPGKGKNIYVNHLYANHQFLDPMIFYVQFRNVERTITTHYDLYRYYGYSSVCSCCPTRLLSKNRHWEVSTLETNEGRAGMKKPSALKCLKKISQYHHQRLDNMPCIPEPDGWRSVSQRLDKTQGR